MRWAAAYAVGRLLVLAALALAFVYFFRDGDGAANPYVQQLDRWLGLDELLRAIDGRF
jgi:hypothetical protein